MDFGQDSNLFLSRVMESLSCFHSVFLLLTFDGGFTNMVLGVQSVVQLAAEFVSLFAPGSDLQSKIVCLSNQCSVFYFKNIYLLS